MKSLAGHFWSPEVTWRHFLSSDCLLLELQRCRKWNVQYTEVFDFLQPLPGDFRSNEVPCRSLPVTWGHVTSFPVTWLTPTAIYSHVGSKMYSMHKFSACSHFQVTSGQMTSLPGLFRLLMSRDVISCYVTASYCELQPCRKWNVQYTRVVTYSHFQILLVKWRHFEVTFGHLRSRDIPCQVTAPTASYIVVESEMYSICEFSAFNSHFLVTSNQMTSLPGHFRSPEVTSPHFLSRHCLLLRATAL